MSDLLSSRPDLEQGWADMERAVERTGLDPDLIAWSEARVRQLLGVADTNPVDPPDPVIADFVEMFFIDVHGVSDDQARDTAAALGDSMFVALVVCLGMLEARVRMELMVR